MSAFICIDELAAVYELLFEALDEQFLVAGETSIPLLDTLTRLLDYYDGVLRRRASRRIPIAISLTFEIIRFFVQRHKLIRGITDQTLLENALDSLHQSAGTRVFKAVNQIVDLNQKSKFALSLQHILKKLDFKQAGLIAHLRNAFFHQDSPSRKEIERVFRVLLTELKTLFWDKNYYWYLNLTTDENYQLQKAASRYKIEAMAKAEINDVDEYCDLCLAQKDLRILMTEQMGKPAQKDTLQSFLKYKVKGLHRKVIIAIHVAQQAIQLLHKQLITHAAPSQEDLYKTDTLEILLILLLEIFQSNINMHRVLNKGTLARLIGRLSTLCHAVGRKSFYEALQRMTEKSEGKLFGVLVDCFNKPTNKINEHKNGSARTSTDRVQTPEIEQRVTENTDEDQNDQWQLDSNLGKRTDIPDDEQLLHEYSRIEQRESADLEALAGSEGRRQPLVIGHRFKSYLAKHGGKEGLKRAILTSKMSAQTVDK